jgi:hypothetical protein
VPSPNSRTSGRFITTQERPYYIILRPPPAETLQQGLPNDAGAQGYPQTASGVSRHPVSLWSREVSHPPSNRHPRPRALALDSRQHAPTVLRAARKPLSRIRAGRELLNSCSRFTPCSRRMRWNLAILPSAGRHLRNVRRKSPGARITWRKTKHRSCF